VLAQTDRQTPSRENPEVSEKKKGKNPILFGKSSTCPTLSRSRNQTEEKKDSSRVRDGQNQQKGDIVAWIFRPDCDVIHIDCSCSSSSSII